MNHSQPAIAACLGILLVLAPAVARAENEGLDDLDKAIEQKLAVRSLNDLSKTIDLLQAALNKGLDDQNTTFAQQLLGEALLERATVLTDGLAKQAPPVNSEALIRLWKIAVADVKRALQLQAESPRAQLLYGRLLAAAGRRKQAIEALNACVDSVTDAQTELAAQALTLRGTLQTDKQKRKADLDRALELLPDRVEALRARAELLQQQGEFDAALADLKRAIELAPDAAAGYEAQGSVLAAKEDDDAALKSLDKAIELAPRRASAYAQRAQIRLRKGQPKLALDDLDQAVQINPRAGVLLALRANIRLLTGDISGAQEDVDNALQLQPGYLPALRLRAEILAHADKFAEAIASLKTIAEARPQDHALQMQLGRYYLADNQIDLAIATFEKQLQADPDSANALRLRGDAYLAAGRQAQAIADYRAALKLDPDNSGLLNNLAWVLATSPDEQLRDGAEAVRLATLACAQTKYEEAHILSTLASSYAEIGDFEKAVEWSQKAVDLGKESAQVVQLKKELESYHEKKPWRELQSVVEPKDSSQPDESPDAPPDADQQEEAENPAAANATSPPPDEDRR
jgi:tetratricopeptide (TPR) repeat protein